MNFGKDDAERFIRRNATRENVIFNFAEVVRFMMKALSAGSSFHSSHRAAQRIDMLIAMLPHARFDHTDNTFTICRDAAALLRDGWRDCEYPDHVYAALAGMNYLGELVANDNAAAGRASQRLQDFIAAIKACRL